MSDLTLRLQFSRVKNYYPLNPQRTSDPLKLNLQGSITYLHTFRSQNGASGVERERERADWMNEMMKAGGQCYFFPFVLK